VKLIDTVTFHFQLLLDVVGCVTSRVQGEWGVKYESEEEAELQRRSEFCQTVLSESRSQICILHRSYQVHMLRSFKKHLPFFSIYLILSKMQRSMHTAGVT